MPELIYSFNKSGLILFEEDVVRTLCNWRQIGNQPEAGGILIGYRRPPHIHVIACTTPFPKDKSSRFEFLRRDQEHLRIAHEYWRDTKGKAYYLGDWHTHPVDTPTPSTVDRNEWHKLMKSSLGPNLLFVIIGRTKWHVQLATSPLNKCRLARKTGTAINSSGISGVR